MKKDWEIKKISDACEIVKDKPEKFKGIKNYYSTGAINNSGNYDEPEKITYIGRPSRANIYPKDGDVGFAKMKLTNKVLRIDNSLNGSVFSTGFCFLRPRKFLDNKFLYYFIISDLFQELKDFYAGDGIMGGIKNSALENIKIPLPPLLEQKNIVKILDEVFEKIEKVKENTEKNLKNSKELFDSSLHDIFSKPKNNWEKKTLNEISTYFGRGKSKHRPRNDKKLYNGSYPFIQTGDIRNCDHFITNFSQTYNDVGLKQSKLWPKGTICITIAANIAETGILSFDACFPDSVIGIIVNPKIAETDFVEYLLQSFKVKIQAKGKGSAQKNINLKTFENELFPFPPLSEQKSIISDLNILSAKIKKMEIIYKQKLADIDELERSILKRAFNGDL